MDRNIVAESIAFLKGQVFKDNPAFEILDADVNRASAGINAIPMASEILKPSLVAAFHHIYAALTSKEKSISACLANIATQTNFGNGSLIQSFFGGYINKLATANGLEIKRIVDLQRAQTEAEIKRQSASAVIDLGKKAIGSPGNNSLFSSVAKAFGSSNTARLREMAIEYIKQHKSEYEDLITSSSFDEYITIYSQDGRWDITENGNNIMIGALAKALRVDIMIHERSGLLRKMNPQADLPVIHLNYNGNHYSIYIQEIKDDKPIEPSSAILEAKSGDLVSKMTINLQKAGNAAVIDERKNAFNQKNLPAYYYQATDISVIQRQLMANYYEAFSISEPLGDNIGGDISKRY